MTGEGGVLSPSCWVRARKPFRSSQRICRVIPARSHFRDADPAHRTGLRPSRRHARLSLNETKPVSAVRVYGGMNPASWTRLHEWKGAELRRKQQCFVDRRYPFLKVAAYDKGGGEAAQAFFHREQSRRAPAGLECDSLIVFDEAVFNVTSRAAFDRAPRIAFHTNASGLEPRILAVSPSHYRIVLKAKNGFNGRRRSRYSQAQQ